jgi:hypothetical protein
MKKHFIWIPVLLLLLACKGKKASMAEEEEVLVEDFIAFFPERKLPVTIGDTTLLRKPNDSLLISYKVFTRFIPDSLLKNDFGAAKPKLYAVGRTKEKGRETYLFAKAILGNKRVGYLACFNKDDEFLNAMSLVKTGVGNYSSAYGLLDNKFQITTYREKKNRGSDVTYKKNVYFYNNSANEFTLILTEPNEDIIQDVINPIDTFSRKYKFSGEYIRNKRNFISVRDGKNATEILFFVHFEKDNGECTGELKGRARFIAANKALYNESGNPCALELTFTAGSVSIKETGGCGTYRDIKCFFEGSFPKKKEAKAKGKK